MIISIPVLEDLEDLKIFLLLQHHYYSDIVGGSHDIVSHPHYSINNIFSGN